MIPSGDLSTITDSADFVEERIRASWLEDYELGGIALSDPSLGLDVQLWYAWYENGAIFFKSLGGTL
jgi:hypothetical protein